MNENQALELVRQNGVGKEIRCFFISENKIEETSHMSVVNNYKFNENDNVVKIYVDRNSYEKHQKILTSEKEVLPNKSSNCYLLIKKDENKITLELKLFCNFLETKNQFIYAKAYSAEYLDDTGTKKRLKI